MRRIISGVLVVGLAGVALPRQVEGRGQRSGEIPNGGELGCSNCHMSAFGGDARNPFGLTVEADFLDAGNVVWGPELAAIDSDGDGYTNGAELGDPDGTWVSGDPNPEVDEVYHPGDAESHPPEMVETAVEESTWASVKFAIGKLLR